MVRYNYSKSVEPPAPFVHVTVGNPSLKTTATDVPALLDCAADRTVIPSSLVEQLGLVQIDEVPIMGFGGHVVMSPTYLAELTIRQLNAVTVEVIAETRRFELVSCVARRAKPCRRDSVGVTHGFPPICLDLPLKNV